MSVGMVMAALGRLFLAALVVLCLAPRAALANEAPDEAVDEPPDASAPSTDPAKTDSEVAAPTAHPSGPVLEFSGRVFARAQADERTEFARDLSIPSARLGVEATFGIARAVLEADVADSSIIKDAYIRLEDEARDLKLYAGHFKAPLLTRTTESRWKLPLIDRGLLNEYLIDQNQLGGRRIGLLGQFKKKKWLGLNVELGAFEGAKDQLGTRLGEDLSARAAFEPWEDRLELGATAYWANFTGGALERYVAGADATLKLGGARVTGEALAGRIGLGDFTAGLLTTSYLLPLGGSQWAVEPVLGAESLQLRGPVAGQGYAGVLGLNVHYTDRIKLMAQGERGLFPGDEGPKNRFAVQLAARF